MIRREHRGVTVECLRGNIAAQPGIDAVVNAANSALRSGGGVAGAIHRAAGPGLEAECRPLAPIRPGQAVITGAHNLPNRHVIHCRGPVYGQDEPAETLLAACYRNALALAEQHGLTSVAFPAISTGVFGYPMDAAARVAIGTVIEEIPALASVRHIRFVLYETVDESIHARVLQELLPAGRPAAGNDVIQA
jgi:O-acetyl-ADP-ribose deacetylase